MNIFLILLFKIFPLYALILLGYIAGKYFHIKKDTVSALLLYIFVPVVFFNGAYTTPINFATLSLPLLFFVVCSLMCLSFLFISRFVWSDSVTRHIFAFMTGEANVVYLGLPIITALLGNDVIGIAVLCTFGFWIYESSVGYFVAARGKHSVRKSINKLLRIPTIYAIFLGLLVNILGIHLGDIYADFVINFKGAFIVLGMMLVGLAVSDLTELKFDLKFMAMAFLSKFIVFPLIMILIIYMDIKYFHIYTAEIHKVIFLMSIVPIAANAIIYATILKAHPEKVAVAILSTTLFALLYIPLLATLFLSAM